MIRGLGLAHDWNRQTSARPYDGGRRGGRNFRDGTLGFLSIGLRLFFSLVIPCFTLCDPSRLADGVVFIFSSLASRVFVPIQGSWIFPLSRDKPMT